MTDTAGTKEKRRPSPDALLELARREKRGKLKIFIGAAPGVGKTYAMLAEARRLKADGVDVVVGIVETHGRSETGALLEGLEVMPRRPIAYRGRALMEFDLDAALARRPEIIIVDELAHSNAPGSRHTKRHQDVAELLEAGISVLAAVNIQHLESLRDVVSRITGVTVRETIPDTVIETANEVVVVDITPDELIKRLKEGKVYLPENARRAADSFFRPGNLTALRELALRRTADRVEGQMVEWLRQHAIEGPWPTSERILVCVGRAADCEIVVREAHRLADGLGASLLGLTIESPGQGSINTGEAHTTDEAMRLVERLGGETVRISASDLPSAVLRYARAENITQIVVGRSKAGFVGKLLRRSLSDEIVDRAEGIAVHIVTTDKPTRRFKLRLPPRPRLEIREALMAVGSVAVAVGFGTLLELWRPLPNLSMIFLTAVLLSAMTYGLRAAIAAALLSFLAFNFFFITPRYTFTVANAHELFSLFIFLLVAVLTGGLAARVRAQRDAIAERATAVETLYDFSRRLSGAAHIDDVLWAAVSRAAAAVEGEAIILLARGKELDIRAGFPPEDTLGPAEWAAARWCFVHDTPAGWKTETLPHARFQFRPLRTSRGVIGVIGVRHDKQRPVAGATLRQLDALLDQTAVAIERTQLAAESAVAQSEIERERLRSALLSSISHDLRTPLASILGAATSLRELGANMSEAVRADLLAAIEEEARRLSRFVANLLDMTRLGSENLDLTKDWVDVADAVRAAADRAARNFPGRRTEIDLASPLPLIRGDSNLLEQCVFNVLDNADKYSEAGTPTRVACGTDGTALVISVSDQGAGIPPEHLDKVFEKFHRVAAGDGRAAGTGLGLAICRRVIEAFGGTIHAESPLADGRGTRIVIRLPASTDTSVPKG